jgi:hypothetical protein
MLQASASTPDGSATKPAQASSKDAPAPQEQGETPADPALVVPALSVDLALLVPELPLAVGARDLVAATKEKGEGDIQANTDAAPADPGRVRPW